MTSYDFVSLVSDRHDCKDGLLKDIGDFAQQLSSSGRESLFDIYKREWEKNVPPTVAWFFKKAQENGIGTRKPQYFYYRCPKCKTLYGLKTPYTDNMMYVQACPSCRTAPPAELIVSDKPLDAVLTQVHCYQCGIYDKRALGSACDNFGADYIPLTKEDRQMCNDCGCGDCCRETREFNDPTKCKELGELYAEELGRTFREILKNKSVKGLAK